MVARLCGSLKLDFRQRLTSLLSYSSPTEAQQQLNLERNISRTHSSQWILVLWKLVSMTLQNLYPEIVQPVHLNVQKMFILTIILLASVIIALTVNYRYPMKTFVWKKTWQLHRNSPTPACRQKLIRLCKGV